MNSRERILSALRREKPDRPPWMEISFHPQVASSILGEELKSQGSGFFPMDDGKEYKIELSKWIRLAKKINLDALALKLWGPNFAEERGPTYFGGTIKTLKDWEEAVASIPDMDDHDCYRCAEVLIKEAREEGIASFLETHFGFENVLESIGFKDFCIALFQNVNLIERMLDFYVGFYSKVIRCFIKLRPDFLVIGDDLAYGHGPFVSPRQWKDIFQPRFKKVAAGITCPWVFHSDGNLLPIMESLLDLGMNAIHPIEPYGTLDIVEVKKKYGDRVCLAGNLDMNIIAHGGTEDIEREVKWLYENVGRDGGWILSSSNTIDKGANPKNVVEMGKTLTALK